MTLSPRLLGARIGVRLGAAFGTLALLLVACVAFGVVRLSSLNDTMQSVLDHEARASVLSAELVGQAHETSAALGRAVMSDSVDDIQANLKQADKLRADVEATKKSLAEALDNEAARAALKQAEAAEPAYRAALGKVITAIKDGDTDAARLALNDKSLRSAEAAYLGALEKFDAQQHEAMKEAKRSSMAAFATGRTLLFSAALAAAVLAAVLGVSITRSVTRPLGEAVSLTEAVAAGDLTHRIDA